LKEPGSYFTDTPPDATRIDSNQQVNEMTKGPPLLLPIATSRRHAAARGVAVAAAALVTGCYDYIESPTGGFAPDAQVRAILTDAGSSQLGVILGPRVTSIDGRVERAGADSLVLRVSRVALFNGAESEWNGERVGVPMSAVGSVRERRLDRPRTVLAILVVGGAVVAGWLSQHIGSTPEPPIGGGPTVAQ
jgi:hypothetical protein